MYPLFLFIEYFNDKKNPFLRPNYLLYETFRILFHGSANGKVK